MPPRSPNDISAAHSASRSSGSIASSTTARGSRATRSSFPSATPRPTIASSSRCSPRAWPTAASISSVARWRGCCGSWRPRPPRFVRDFDARRDAARLRLLHLSLQPPARPRRVLRGATRPARPPRHARRRSSSPAIPSRHGPHRPRAGAVLPRVLSRPISAMSSRAAGSRAATATSSRWPSAGGPCKRLHLFLRWMVRREAPDLGLWTSVSPARLLMPVDTHIENMSRALGLTRRRSRNWRWPRRSPRAWRRSIPPTR